MERYEIKLSTNGRKFSAFSNLPDKEVFDGANWNQVFFLLHGFPDNYHSFDELWGYLIMNENFEKQLLIAPRMRGYEISSQGNEDDYRILDLASDVIGWVKNVNSKDKPVFLIGHDWGAVTAFKVASIAPKLITSIACLAIPYLTNLRFCQILWYAPEQVFYSSYMFTMQASFLYKTRLTDKSKNSYLDKLWGFWSPNWDYGDKINSIKADFSNPDIVTSATAYYRCLVKFQNYKQNFWKVDFSSVPTIILGGEDDRCMSKKLFELESMLLKDKNNAEIILLEHAGHFLHRERPQEVASMILDWFSLHSN